MPTWLTASFSVRRGRTLPVVARIRRGFAEIKFFFVLLPSCCHLRTCNGCILLPLPQQEYSQFSRYHQSTLRVLPAVCGQLQPHRHRSYPAQKDPECDARAAPEVFGCTRRLLW